MEAIKGVYVLFTFLTKSIHFLAVIYFGKVNT